MKWAFTHFHAAQWIPLTWIILHDRCQPLRPRSWTAGLFIIVVWLFADLLRGQSYYLPPALAGATLLILAVMTPQYTLTWTNTETLFTAAAEKWPTSVKARMNAGYAIAQRGDLHAALPHYIAALELAPHLAETRGNYGVAQRKLGETDAAIAQFRRAASDDPTLVVARFNLATHLLRKEDGAAETAEILHQVLQDDPDLSIANYWLGCALEANGLLREAEDQYRKRVADNPKDTSAFVRLARLRKGP